MVAFRLPRFWRTADSVSDGSSLRTTTAHTTDDDEDTDGEESFFDLVFNSPDGAIAAEGERATAVKKDLQFIESPRDVFFTKREFSNSKNLSPGKFKVFMLRLVKSPKCEANGDVSSSPQTPLMKPPKTDNSLRREMLMKENSETSSHKSAENSVLKYLKVIKPLYLKVLKRMNEKEKFASSLTPSSSPVSAVTNTSTKRFYIGCRVGSFKIVANQLLKSRSASASSNMTPSLARRSNDSVLEQHDGIQSAILHCKKSYNSSSQDFSKSIEGDMGRRCSI